MSTVCYWDSATNSQKERDATAEEEAEIITRKNAPIDKNVFNAPILAEIQSLDIKRIRPLAESDSTRLQELNAKIAELRLKLMK